MDQIGFNFVMGCMTHEQFKIFAVAVQSRERVGS
jgi:hypothetical protein